MTEPDAEAPIRPVLGGRRTTRERGRIVAVGALAVLLFGAGIGLAGNGFSNEPARSGTPPSSIAPSLPTPPPTADATPVPPTQNAGLGCAPVRIGSPPEIRLSSDAGAEVAVTGVAASPAPSPSRGPGRGPTPSSAPNPAWPVPGEPGAIRLGGQAGLILAPDGDACIRYVLAEYRPADPTLSGPFPIAFRTLNVSPLQSVVALGSLPAGDWVVRIVTYLSDGVVGEEDAIVVERFFRVISGAGAGPLPVPASSPAVPCAPLAAGAPAPDLLLAFGDHQPPALGIPPGTGTPPSESAERGAMIEIRTRGDVCARSWSITAHLVEDGQDYVLGTQGNPTSDPFQYAQNRWPLPSVPSGTLQITATMDFSVDVHVTRRWSLAEYFPSFPSVEFVAADGSLANATPRCGASWTYPTGTGGTETCTGPAFFLEDLETLRVAPGQAVRVEVPGWTIASWEGVCGRPDSANLLGEPFLLVDSCALGGSLAPGPVAFLPRHSGPLVRIFMVLERDGVTAADHVYTTIETAP